MGAAAREIEAASAWRFPGSSKIPITDGNELIEKRRVMRRRAFNQAGGISKWFAPKRSYTERPLILEGKGTAPESEAQDGALDDMAEEQQTPLGHENGVIGTQKSRAQRPLPLSPLMDPSYLAAKQNYKLPKAAPSKEPTPFQQQLAKNPYAQALATPVRMCSLTRTQLPSFFLQDFELIAHPTTNEPWYLPRSLTSAHSSSPVTDGDISPGLSQSMGIRRGPRSYVLSRASLIRAIRTPRSGYTYGEERFASQQAKQFSAFREMKTRWRSDMDTFVLDLMRRRIVEGLKYLGERKAGYLQGCSDWDYAKGSKQVGAFLWLGQESGKKVVAGDEFDSPANDEEKVMAVGQERITAVGETEAAASTHNDATYVGQEDGTLVSEEEDMVQENNSIVGPGEFATLDMDKEMKSKLPVHNLQLLLGNTLIEDLRRHEPRIFKHEIVALKNKRTTIDMQLRLWKLQGYLAGHKQVDDE